MSKSTSRALAALAVVVGLGASGLAAADGAAKGQAAPAFTLPTVDGHSVSLAKLRGKVVLVDFWGTWCQPCSKELPALATLYKRLHAKGLEIVAINLDEKREDVDRYLKPLGLPYTVALDPKQDTAGAYSPETMPSSFLVDRAGRIAYVNVGYHDGDDAKIEAAISQALGGR